MLFLKFCEEEFSKNIWGRFSYGAKAQGVGEAVIWEELWGVTMSEHFCGCKEKKQRCINNKVIKDQLTRGSYY